MWKFKKLSPRCFCRLLVALFTLATVRSQEIKDFIAVNTLPDGEVETRIFYRGISAKEVTVARGSTSDIKFRQLATRRHLIQLIYSEGEDLKDCEIVHQIDQVKKFLYNFKSDLRNLIATSNVTVESLDDKTLPSGFSTWFNYTKLKSSCRQLHRQMKKEIREKQKQRNRSSWTWKQKRSIFILPGTLWCGQSHNARHYTELGVMSKTDKCCRKHDHCKRSISAFSTKFHYHNLTPFTISHCHCDARFHTKVRVLMEDMIADKTCMQLTITTYRHKRDVSDLLRIPGTKWCGKGYSADKYTRLGGFSRTDKCCRRHDLSCPFWIGAFETKYGLFNWRVNTIMHCSCDERFRACLKMVDSSDANLVGKLFFNVVQSKCFVIKPKKVCIKSSWWGQCEKYRHEKRAILRDNLPY